MNMYTSYPSKTYKRKGEHLTISLTYVAKHRDEHNGMELMRDLELWRRYFDDTGIASILVINDGYFLQNFQGSRPAVNEALARIMNDYAQIEAQVVEVQELEERQYRGYLIKHLTTSVEDEEYTLKHFSAGHDFNPYMMSGKQIDGFLTAIFKNEKLRNSAQ